MDSLDYHPEYLYVSYANTTPHTTPHKVPYKVPYNTIPLFKEIYEYANDGVGSSPNSPIILTLSETENTLINILEGNISIVTPAGNSIVTPPGNSLVTPPGNSLVTPLDKSRLTELKYHLDYFKMDTSDFERELDRLLLYDYNKKVADFFENNLYIFDQLFQIIPFNKQECLNMLNDWEGNRYIYQRRTLEFYKNKFNEAIGKHVQFSCHNWRSYLFGSENLKSENFKTENNFKLKKIESYLNKE